MAPEGRKNMSFKEWAKANGLEERYNKFLEECDMIAEKCAEEGYPSHGSNYELRVEELEKDYPDLFGDD